MTMIAPQSPARTSVEHALAAACRAAKREFPVVGTPECPTAYDAQHQRIDGLLDDWLDSE